MNILFLNSLGTGEVILILFVVLILFGSKGIPDFAKNIGKGMREIRTASDEIKRDLQNSALEMRKDLNLKDPLEGLPKMDDLMKVDSDKPKSTPPVEPREDSKPEEQA